MSCCNCFTAPKAGTQQIIIPDGAGGSTTARQVDFKKGQKICFIFRPGSEMGTGGTGRPYQPCVGVSISPEPATSVNVNAAPDKYVVISIGCGVTCVEMSDDIRSIWIDRLTEGFVLYWVCEATTVKGC